MSAARLQAPAAQRRIGVVRDLIREPGNSGQALEGTNQIQRMVMARQLLKG
jgi:hypothetical protein